MADDDFVGSGRGGDRISSDFFHGASSVGGALVWSESDGTFQCGDSIGGVVSGPFDLCAQVESDGDRGDGESWEKLSDETGGSILFNSRSGVGSGQDGAQASRRSKSDCLDFDGGWWSDPWGGGLAEAASGA